MYFVATEQYTSNLSFSVRSEQLGNSPLQLLGMPQLSGSATSDTDILYQYLFSQDLVQAVDKELGLHTIYHQRDNDFIFSLPKNAQIERILQFWKRVVHVNLDNRTGIIFIKVMAFDAVDAQNVAKSIRNHATTLLNKLSEEARKDATQYAEDELERAITRLTNARTELILFRKKTNIIDPSAGVEGQMNVVNTLQQKLIEAQIEAELLATQVSKNDPRMKRADHRVKTLQSRLEAEKLKISETNNQEIGFANLVSEYEALLVEKEFAEQQYISSLATLDKSIAEAQRQSRYLAAHIEPTLSQTPLYPKRFATCATVFAFGFLVWSLISLVYYSVRDRV